MRNFFAPAHLALSVIILIWDIVLAGRIAQNRQAPRVFQAVCGLCALLLLPGLLFNLATSTIITGRAVVTMDWIWPAVLVLFAIQSAYALVRGLVNLIWGFPIAVYNILIAMLGVSRYMVAHGFNVAEPFVEIMGAQSLVMVLVTTSPDVLASPFFLNIPMISPAFPALRSLTVLFRAMMTVIAFVWTALIPAVGVPRAIVKHRNYDSHRRDPLHERPEADFAVGLKILPEVYSPPPPPSIRADSALRVSMGVDAVAVVVAPGASRLAIDSLAKVVAPTRTDSTILVVAIGYREGLLPSFTTQPLNEEQRLATLRLVIERLRPDIVLPAEDPYGRGRRVVGVLSPERWQSFLTEAARVAKRADKNVAVGVAASAFTPNDSALYAWAASRESPIDIVGFSLLPCPYVGCSIEDYTRTADRWMKVMKTSGTPTKDHWIFATGGYPLAYGERLQENAVWEALAWGTAHAEIKGAIVYEAGDYGQARGLRAPNGRVRPVTRRVISAIQQLRESAR